MPTNSIKRLQDFGGSTKWEGKILGCDRILLIFLPQGASYKTKAMNERTLTAPTTWLRTDRAVVPTNGVGWIHLIGVESALQRGLFAIKDVNHPEFYEIEVGEIWYYIHI